MVTFAPDQGKKAIDNLCNSNICAVTIKRKYQPWVSEIFPILYIGI